MLCMVIYNKDFCSRPPRGGRGLKFNAGLYGLIIYTVAPLAGGVD